MESLLLTNSTSIEFHFQLDGNNHEMNALVLHTCNTEMLSIFQMISELFQTHIDIETIALGEGGLRQKWKILNDNSGGISVILTVVLALFSLSSISQCKSKEEIRNIELQNEKLELEIEQLKNARHGSVVTKESIESFNQKYEIAHSRSRYYQVLLNYSKVSGVEYILRNADNQVELQTIVTSDNFDQYIGIDENIPDGIDENASIVLISPVLIDKKYKWKGTYNDKPIDFFMNDNNFKEEIKLGSVHFQVGSTLKCKLVIRQKIEEGNALKITSYAVDQVYSVSDATKTYFTINGNQKRRADRDIKDQIDMEFGEEPNN